MPPGNYDPEQERLWAEQRHQCLVRWIVDHPDPGARLLEKWEQNAIDPEKRDQRKRAYAQRLRAEARQLWLERQPKPPLPEGERD
jgi:hypothetical protein